MKYKKQILTLHKILGLTTGIVVFIVAITGCFWAFKEEIEEYRVELGIPKNKTFIMPAGDNREQLIKMYPIVFNMCAEHGYNMTGRDHIIAFDQQRMV